jgi:hypothetical protein
MIPVPKQWDEPYLRECAEDEIELARLLRLGKFAAPAGLTRDTVLVPAPPKSNGFFGSANNSRTRLGSVGELPRWRRDWSAAGSLSTELGLNTYHDPEDGSVSVSAGGRRRNVTERYEDHPGKDAATMAAIVRAAIQKLEAGNSN